MPTKKELFQIGDIVRYADGPTAIMRISLVSRTGDGDVAKYVRYYGQHVLGGVCSASHSMVRRASPKDREIWYDEGRRTTSRGAPLRAPWKQFMEKYGSQNSKVRKAG